MRAWKKIQSRLVLRDRWLHLTADRCELPDGAVIEPYYVMHELDWVHVLATDCAGKLLVVRQYRYAADVTCLELPGGVIEMGEDPLAAAQRELLEETGCTSADWTFVGLMFANPARQTNRVHVFIARGVTMSGVPHLDSSEDIESSWRSLSEVEEAIENGDFSQALHVASFYRCSKLVAEFSSHVHAR